MKKASLQDQKIYAPWLWLLFALLAFRVLAQPVQARFALPFLPAFEQWQGSSLPYGVLLASQLIILLLLATIAWRFSSGRVTPRPRVGITLLAIGGLYFILMLARLVLGLTLFSHSPWFARLLPAFFHLVLASFLLLLGHFHWHNGDRAGE